MNGRRNRPLSYSYTDVYGKLRFSSNRNSDKIAGYKYAPGGETGGKVSGKDIAGGISSVSGGIGGIVSAASANAQIADTSEYKEAIQEQKNKTYDTSDYSSLLSGYDGSRLKTNLRAKDIRGLSAGQAVGNTLSAVGSGAQAGSVAGPWGAAAGAVVGLGSAIGGIFSGKRKAKKMAAKLNKEAKEANEEAINDFSYAAGQVSRKNAEKANANFKAGGGELYGTIGQAVSGLGSAISAFSGPKKKIPSPWSNRVSSAPKIKDPNKSMDNIANGVAALTGVASTMSGLFNKKDDSASGNANNGTANNNSGTTPSGNGQNLLTPEGLNKSMDFTKNKPWQFYAFGTNNNPPKNQIPFSGIQQAKVEPQQFGGQWRNVSLFPSSSQQSSLGTPSGAPSQVPTSKKDGGQLYEESKTYNLSEREIKRLIKAGYELEYV